MALDQIVEQLAFGKVQAPSGPALGLYISPETIYIAETKLGKDGKLSVEHLVRIPVPPAEGAKSGAGSTVTMSTDFLADPTKLGGLIRQSMSQVRWGTKNVVVTLSHHLGLIRYFAMPMIERRFLRTAIPVEAKKYIPIPFDALAYDFQAAPMPPDAAGKARQGVLIAVTQKNNLSGVLGLVKHLGLNLVGLEVAPCSVLRVWQTVEPPAGPEPVVQVHFDGGSVRVMICERGLPVFFREVFLGAEASLADQRKVDLPGCLSFAGKQLGLTGIVRVKLSGAPAVIAPWKDAFSSETGLPVEIQDTAKLLSIKGGDWGGYSAIGASTRAQKPGPTDLDLSVTDRVTDEETQAARDIIVGGAALAAAIALMGLWSQVNYTMRARELKQYSVDPKVKAALQGMDATAIEKKLADMREQLEQLQGVGAQGAPKLSVVLKEAIDIMPDSVWLTKINVTSPLVREKDKGLQEIYLMGRARGSSPAEEQDMAFQYRDALQRSELIGKAYEIQISMQGRTGPDPAAGGMDPKMLLRRLEERTSFTLTLKQKRPGAP